MHDSSRRTFLRGLAATGCVLYALPAHAGKPMVLVFTSNDGDRQTLISKSFRDAIPETVRMSYDLGGERDAGAFIADNIRGMPVNLVFAVGDLALKAAAREFTTIPLIYAEATDIAPVRGRDTAFGVSTRKDPTDTISRLKVLHPTIQELGLIRSAADFDPYWDRLEAAATEQGLTTKTMPVASSAEVPNAMKTLVHHADFIWLQEDPVLWTGTTASACLRIAFEAMVPVASFDVDHLTAPQPAALAIVLDGAKVGEAAAALVDGALDPNKPVPQGTYPKPQIVGSVPALRHAGVKVSKKTAEAIDEWAVR